MKGSINNDAKGKQHMKSAALITTRISNDVIFEQLKNSRCTFARDRYIPLPNARLKVIVINGQLSKCVKYEKTIIQYINI